MDIESPSPSADLISEHLTWLRAGGLSNRTIGDAGKLLHRVDATLPKGLAGALSAELAGWLAGPDNRQWSTQTRATYRGHIVRFYTWACDPDDPVLDYNPAARLRRPRVRPHIPDPASDDQVRRCLTTTLQPWRLHCLLAAYAGLRPMEIADLHRADIDEHHIRVRDGKGHKPARIPTEPIVWRAVMDLPDGPITRKSPHAPATARWVSGATRAHLYRRGIRTSLRRLRAWHATHLRRHVDPFVVQQRMRHESVATTQRYVGISAAELAASVGLLPDYTWEG